MELCDFRVLMTEDNFGYGYNRTYIGQLEHQEF